MTERILLGSAGDEPFYVDLDVLLEAIDWDEFDEEAWRQAAALFIETVLVRHSDRRGWPIVDVMWTPTASVILEAVLQGV